MTNEKILLQLEKGYNIKNPQLAQALSNLEDKIGITKAELEEAIETKANLVGGKVPAEELPSYVDDVIEFNGLLDPSTRISTIVGNSANKNRTYFVSGSDPNSGRVGSSDKYPYMFVNFGENTSEEDWISETPERGKIYLNISNDHSYRWTGSELLDLDKNWSTAIVGLSQNTIRTDTSQDFSTERENQALSNIGSGLFVVDLVDGKATLTADQEAKLLSSSGVILRGTVSAGKEVLTKIYFADYQGGNQVSFWAVRNNEYILQCIYTKSTKLFQFLTSKAYIDPNAVSIKSQTLSTAQQTQALANLGMKVYVTDSSFLGSTLSAEEIEQVAASKALLFTDTGDLFLLGVLDSARVTFTRVKSNYIIDIITVTKSTGGVSILNSYNFRDNEALRFVTQSPALTAFQQEIALSNIGLGFVIVDYSELSTTLSDDRLSQLVNAKGLILTNTPDNYTRSVVFIAGTRLVNSITFSSVKDAQNINYIILNIPNKVLSLVQTSELVISSSNQNLTNTRKDTVLSNIGLNWIHVPYSLLSTTLGDETYTKLTNAYGIILTDVPSDYFGPREFICGSNNSDGTKVFAGLNLANTSAYIVLYVNHNLTNVRYARTYDGAVPYDASKTLTSAQQAVARTNIGVQSADELLEDANFITQLKTKLGIE